MLEFEEIVKLIEKVENSNLDEFKMEHGNLKLSLKKNTGAVVIKQAPKEVVPVKEVQVEVKAEKVVEKPTTSQEKEKNVDKSTWTPVKAPMVGTFYSAADPESSDFVKIGDKVNNGDVLCILEAMKLFNEIQAESSGEIAEILVENGQLVEYGQVLFYLK